MPELPETATIASDLDREIAGLRIEGVRVRHADVLRETTARALRARVVSARVTRVWRRAKCVVLDLSTDDHLVVQPRFTGALLLDAGALAERERRYAAVAFLLSDTRTLLYRDIRRLGTVALMSPTRWSVYSAALGLEPLDPSFTSAHLSGILRGSRRPVKAVLMDQRRLAGVGNIYANESLWGAGIDPSRPAASLTAADAARLHRALGDVLRAAVDARGTSFRDYRDAAGARGTFAARLAVYGRAGDRCVRCGTRLAETHAVDGRSTVFCYRCQR